jgi:uncharacterized membrane protein YgcG
MAMYALYPSPIYYLSTLVAGVVLVVTALIDFEWLIAESRKRPMATGFNTTQPLALPDSLYGDDGKGSALRMSGGGGGGGGGAGRQQGNISFSDCFLDLID